MPSLRASFLVLVLVLVTVILLAEIRLGQPGLYRVFHTPTVMETITRHLSASNMSAVVNLTEVRRTHAGRSVAMGCAITTRKIPTAHDMLKTLPFFRHLLPSFCSTASAEYLYVFYMGYDFNDPILSTQVGRDAFDKFFKYTLLNKCQGHTVDYKFIRCNHSAKPAWAQNDALLEGYKDGMDYFYMVNDDTIMMTNSWTKAFVKQLESFKPPNVGMVGPKHSGGNTAILTYHFTHRTHIDIFSYFYPRNFTDWFGDDWISKVYEPNNVKKMSNVLVKHTLEKGQRYNHHYTVKKHLKGIIEYTRQTYLKPYLTGLGVDWSKWITNTKPTQKPKAKPTAKAGNKASDKATPTAKVASKSSDKSKVADKASDQAKPTAKAGGKTSDKGGASQKPVAKEDAKSKKKKVPTATLR